MDSLSDVPPFPVSISIDGCLSEAQAKHVESFASVVAGLCEIESRERLVVLCSNGLLGYSPTEGPIVLWLSLRVLHSRHGDELRAAASRRAAALNRLSKYVASDVIGEPAREASPAHSSSSEQSFMLVGDGHNEHAVFRCREVCEAVERAESIARMGGCWAVLLVPLEAAGNPEAVGLRVLTIACDEYAVRDEEVDDATRNQTCDSSVSIPCLLPSEDSRIRDQARHLLALSSPCVAPTSGATAIYLDPPSTSRPDTDPYLLLLPWGPAVLCVGAIANESSYLWPREKMPVRVGDGACTVTLPSTVATLVAAELLNLVGATVPPLA